MDIKVCNGISYVAERESNDYYATNPKVVEMLLKKEKFDNNIWECCCGGGHISNVLTNNGYIVRNSDIIDRGVKDVEILDFLSVNDEWYGDIITNPPYKDVIKYVEHALDLIQDGHKVAMYLKLTFLESKSRKELFKKYPPKHIYVMSTRSACAKNGNEKEFETQSAVAYAWYVWEKNVTQTVLEWL